MAIDQSVRIVENCFSCGEAIYSDEAYTFNRSGRLVCTDCCDSDDEQTERDYLDWAAFNGVLPDRVDHADYIRTFDY